MSAEGDLEFLKNLQRLLVEGEFVATYKFAMLQALADICVETPAAAHEQLEVSTDSIAEKFIEYYWRQARPFAGAAGTPLRVLRQNTGRQAAVINRVEEARRDFKGSYEAVKRDRKRWKKLLHQVRKTVEEMPLLRLQVVGGDRQEFLYRHQSFTSNRILLNPGVAGALRAFHGLITHIVRAAWIAQVRRIGPNRQLIGESVDLEAFLFGSERASLEMYRQILREHQSDRCFYCRADLKGRGQVDHFIPWSRYPVDLGHNFVLAHAGCNGDKRDYLAHPSHLEHWREHVLDAGYDLEGEFDAHGLAHDAGRSRAITVWAYEQGESSGAHVWRARRNVERLTDSWRAVLGVATDQPHDHRGTG